MAHELDARLRAVEQGQVRTEQLITDHITVVDKLLGKTARTLYGEGSEPGLVVRVDREEQKSKAITRLIWIVVSATVGLGATYAASTMF